MGEADDTRGRGERQSPGGLDLEAIRREAAWRRKRLARVRLAMLAEAGALEDPAFEDSVFHLALLFVAATRTSQQRRFLRRLTRRLPRPLVKSRWRALSDRGLPVEDLDAEAAVAEALLRSGVAEMWRAACQGGDPGELDLGAARDRLRTLVNEAATHQVATESWAALRRVPADALEAAEAVHLGEVGEENRGVVVPDEDELLEIGEPLEARVRAEASLSESEEQVWTLYFDAGMGPHEIARQTDRAPGTARSLLSRARSKMRQGYRKVAAAG